MKVVFSGVQPSGNLHIGNYLGAIKNWLELQHQYQCLFCVVDLHTLTLPQDPQILREKIKEVAAIYLAAGIDPEKSLIFVQSQVPAHTELCWILNCITRIPELERMTQFKDKAKEHRKDVNFGLLDYPVLMAADILLYQTVLVPIGDDQKQHLEITRNLAERFNNQFGEVFAVPEPMIQKHGSRIMGLDDPAKKMSKSTISPSNYIALLDRPETIKEKIKRAVTDSGMEIKYDMAKKPAISNLLTIYSLFSGKSIEELEKQYKDSKGYAKFKEDVAEAIITDLTPFQERYEKIVSDEKRLNEILKYGKNKATELAEKTLKEVKEKIGLL